jgi:hypothetical protein
MVRYFPPFPSRGRPETKIEGVQNEDIGRRLFRRSTKVVNLIPGRERVMAVGHSFCEIQNGAFIDMDSGALF